jgi:endonuclease/exonuclease/phosphatase family metal-dependent hydrolase
VTLCVCAAAALLGSTLVGPVAHAQAGCNVVTGTPGPDVLTGTEGNDCIAGLGGDDDITGLGGVDRISGGDGDDVISGGPGNDWIDGGAGHDVIDGDDGSDDLNGGVGDDDLDGFEGDDRLSGSIGDDYLVGGEDNDYVVGGDGDDLLDDAFDEPADSATSDDVLVAGPGDDEVYGGPGSDRLETLDGLAGEAADGGEGSDICTTVDPGDLVENCEPGTVAPRARVGALVQAAGIARRARLELNAETWNVHERLSNDQEIADILAAGVGRSEGDLKVIGLQEMCFDQINDVVESSGRLEDKTGRDWSWEDSRPYENDPIVRCKNGNVVLASVPDSLISNRYQARFTAQEQNECKDSVTEETECRSYVRFDVTYGPRTIRVYSVHIGGPSSVKASQIKELAAAIRAEKLRLPRVVMGDFNVRPGDPSLKPMRKLFRDVLGRRTTPTGTAGPCPTDDAGNRIDYIFIRGIRKQSAFVPRLTDEENVSDHCPIVARLSVA